MAILGICVVLAVVIGDMTWPLLRAVIDQPDWSAHTRRVIVPTAGCLGEQTVKAMQAAIGGQAVQRT